MLKSMTAYSRATAEVELGHFVLEIQTVNRKHLEMQLSLPPGFWRFDPEIRKWIAAHVSRGQVNLRLSANFKSQSPVIIQPNLPFAKQLKKAWEAIAAEVRIEKEAVQDLELFQGVEGLFLFEDAIPDETSYRQVLEGLTTEALKALVDMKIREGELIQTDIRSRLNILKQLLDKIQEVAPESSKKHKQKLKEKLEEVLPGAVENEDRLLREISLFSEKVDIAEEILRFNSHLLQCKYLFESNEKTVGKKLEFILQEMQREINTIGSKAADYEISKNVVEVKSELEKIREQIQNIE